MYKVKQHPDTVKTKEFMTTRDAILRRYLKVCKDASENEEVFALFKCHPDFHEVLEHLSFKLGKVHLELIKKDNPWLLEDVYLNNLLRNDLFGSPKIEDFGSFKASPTTIQYISVLSNLLNKFKNSLQNFKIVEIGGGYGGQCKIIQDICDIHSYDIIDLEEVTLLQKVYLIKSVCYENVELLTNKQLKMAAVNYDLVISNYALSEVSKEDQLEYVERILLNSQHGYITCNQPLNGMNLIEEKFSGSFKIENDIEGEREENFLISW